MTLVQTKQNSPKITHFNKIHISHLSEMRWLEKVLGIQILGARGTQPTGGTISRTATAVAGLPRVPAWVVISTFCWQPVFLQRLKPWNLSCNLGIFRSYLIFPSPPGFIRSFPETRRSNNGVPIKRLEVLFIVIKCAFTQITSWCEFPDWQTTFLLYAIFINNERSANLLGELGNNFVCSAIHTALLQTLIIYFSPLGGAALWILLSVRACNYQPPPRPPLQGSLLF